MRIFGRNAVRIRCAPIAVAGAAVAFLLAGCGGSTPSTPGGIKQQSSTSFFTGGTPGGTPIRGGVVTIDQGEAIRTLDPVAMIASGEIEAGADIFDGLVEYRPGSREPQPALATSWTISPDGLTYLFRIRPHVFFSNGEPLTGEDVVYSLLRQRLPIAVTGPGLDKTWKTISLAGPMTVKLQLTKPQPALIGDLGVVAASIVPKKVIEREGEKAFALHPVGTGPFIFKDATPGYTTITLTRNPHYWRPNQPYLNGLVLNTVPETNARILAVRSGAAQVATGISFSQIASVKSAPGVRLLIEPLEVAMPVFLNDGIAPFNEVNVRRALNYATPREAIIKAVFKGMAEPSNDPIGRMQYWDSKVPFYPYDIAKAKALLKTSSVPNGFSVTMNVIGGEPDSGLVATILQGSWAKIGVHVNIHAVDFATFFEDIFASKFQVGVWSDEAFVSEEYPPDFSLLLDFAGTESGTHSAGTNFNSPRVTALILKAASTQNTALRRKLLDEAQQAIYEEAADITVAELPSRTLVSDKLRGFDVQPTNTIRTSEMWLAK